MEYLAREFGAVAALDPRGLCELGPQTLAEALRSDSLVGALLGCLCRGAMLCSSAIVPRVDGCDAGGAVLGLKQCEGIVSAASVLHVNPIP